MGNQTSDEPNATLKDHTSISIELDAEPVPSANTDIDSCVVQSVSANKQETADKVSQMHYLSVTPSANTPITPSTSAYSPTVSHHSQVSSRLSSMKLPSILVPESVDTTECTVSSFPVTASKHRRNSSFSHVCNGITGSHIDSRISKIAAKFWYTNITELLVEKKLEIACAIFFGMMSSNNEIKKILLRQLTENHKTMEQMSLKMFDMIGFLIRNIVTDGIDLYSMLLTLGVFHQKMGVKIDHFASMLESMHETFGCYFPTKYNIEVKYAMDEILTLCAQIMTGQNLKDSPALNDITKTFETENELTFLHSLDVCLRSEIGREYLYRFLQQTFCDEMAVFLQLLAKFKSQTNSTQLFMVARDIVRTSIEEQASLTLNLSYDCRYNALDKMRRLEIQFLAKETLDINTDFFVEIEFQIHKLIIQNHWVKFVRNIKSLHSKSFGL